MTESFEIAVKEVMGLKNMPDRREIAALYGLYKQATEGDIDTPSPSILDMKGKGKWDAWKSKKGISKEDAMVAYVEVVEKLKTKYG